MQSTSRRTSGRRERWKRRSRRFPADAERESQVVPQVSKRHKDSSFAIAIFLRLRSLCGNVLLALRAATRTGVRVAAYRLCALSQIDERGESEPARFVVFLETWVCFASSSFLPDSATLSAPDHRRCRGYGIWRCMTPSLYIHLFTP